MAGMIGLILGIMAGYVIGSYFPQKEFIEEKLAKIRDWVEVKLS